MNEDEYRLFTALNDRVTDLSKSYRILNDSHIQLQLEFVDLKSKLELVVSLIKWVLGPISGLTLLLRIGELIGVIN